MAGAGDLRSHADPFEPSLRGASQPGTAPSGALECLHGLSRREHGAQTAALAFKDLALDPIYPIFIIFIHIP